LALSDTVGNVVHERIDSSSHGVAALSQVKSGIEQRVWIATLLPPATQIVDQRVYTRGSQAGILLHIPIRIEERVRITSFRSAAR
jgi:hypothetical protein